MCLEPEKRAFQALIELHGSNGYGSSRLVRAHGILAEDWRSTLNGVHAAGGGFRPGPFATTHRHRSSETHEPTFAKLNGNPSTSNSTIEEDTAPGHLIMTYCALLSLAVLRAEYSELNRDNLKRFVGACQGLDGG